MSADDRRHQRALEGEANDARVTLTVLLLLLAGLAIMVASAWAG